MAPIVIAVSHHWFTRSTCDNIWVDFDVLGVDHALCLSTACCSAVFAKFGSSLTNKLFLFVALCSYHVNCHVVFLVVALLNSNLLRIFKLAWPDVLFVRLL